MTTLVIVNTGPSWHAWSMFMFPFFSFVFSPNNLFLTITRAGLWARTAVFSLCVWACLQTWLWSWQTGVSIIRWLSRNGSGTPLLIHGRRPGSLGRRWLSLKQGDEIAQKKNFIEMSHVEDFSFSFWYEQEANRLQVLLNHHQRLLAGSSPQEAVRVYKGNV